MARGPPQIAMEVSRHVAARLGRPADGRWMWTRHMHARITGESKCIGDDLPFVVLVASLAHGNQKQDQPTGQQPRPRPTKPMAINAPISGRPRARAVARGAASSTPRAGDARRGAVSWLHGFGKPLGAARRRPQPSDHVAGSSGGHRTGRDD